MTERFEIQRSRYAFPYHWLTQDHGDGTWTVDQHLRWGVEHLGVLKSATSAALSLSPDSVLDVGCGDGRFARELVLGGIESVIGVDLVEEAIAFARAFNTDLRDHLRFESARLDQVKPGRFGLITMIEVLEHIPESEITELMTGIHDRLPSSGRLLVTVPTTNVPTIEKHERHYDLSTLSQHVGPDFELVDHSWIHRTSRENELLRKIVVNRFFVLQWKFALRMVVSRYVRNGLNGTASDAAHLLAIFRPI